jgi:head-tail adaptor
VSGPIKGGQLRVNRELEKLEQLLRQAGDELAQEGLANAGRITKHWKKLRAEQMKIKAEYDRKLRAAGGEPVDTKDVGSKLRFQSRAIKNAMERRAPEDTHFRRDD